MHSYNIFPKNRAILVKKLGQKTIYQNPFPAISKKNPTTIKPEGGGVVLNSVSNLHIFLESEVFFSSKKNSQVITSQSHYIDPRDATVLPEEFGSVFGYLFVYIWSFSKPLFGQDSALYLFKIEMEI